MGICGVYMYSFADSINFCELSWRYQFSGCNRQPYDCKKETGGYDSSAAPTLLDRFLSYAITR